MPRLVRALLVGGVLCAGACVAAAVPAVADSGHATFRPAVIPPLTPGCAQPTAFGPVTCTFSTGASSFVVPDGVTSVALTLTGGNGASFARASPGRGGLVTVASYGVTPGDVLGIAVGGNGSGFSGGFNGGGAGGSGGDASAGGGGATDVSVGGTRVVVAGGGGGSGGPTNLGLLAGGDAGQDAQPWPNPGNPILGGGGATTSSPGAGGTYGPVPGINGSPGSGATGGAGGTANTGISNWGGGGGGGGLFGGGGGAPPTGGGGGSSYVAPGITGSIGIGGGGPQATVTYQPSGAIVAIALTPQNATAGAGEPAAYTAGGYNADGASVADVTATTTFTIDGDGSCTANACGSESVGTYTVTGTNGAATDTAQLEVVPADAATLEVRPAAATATAGDSATFSAVSIDDFGNEVDVTATTTFTVDGGTCLANACSSEVAGAHIVTGTFGALTGTADLAVVPATPVALDVRPASATVGPGADATFTAVSLDQFDNETDVTASTTFTADGGAASCTANVCTSDTVGSYVVTGTFDAFTDTADLDVVEAAPRTTVAPTTTQAPTTTAAPTTEVNSAPQVTISGPSTAVQGVPVTLKVGAVDSSATDQAGTFTYTVDWGDGTPIVQVTGPADPPVTHAYSAPGIYAVTATATDAGGATSAALTFTITVVGPCDALPTTVATTVAATTASTATSPTVPATTTSTTTTTTVAAITTSTATSTTSTTSSTTTTIASTTTTEPASSTTSTVPTTALSPAGPTGATDSAGATGSEGPAGWASGMRSAVTDPCPSTPPVAPPPQGVGGGAALPATGNDLAPAAYGLALIAVGTALVWMVRRRASAAGSRPSGPG